jgi:hypothetical protein
MTSQSNIDGGDSAQVFQLLAYICLLLLYIIYQQSSITSTLKKIKRDDNMKFNSRVGAVKKDLKQMIGPHDPV